MRHTAAEKYEIVRLVEGSDLPGRRTLRELQVNRSTFYAWYHRDTARGQAGLEPKPGAARRYWNRIPPQARQRVVDAALAAPAQSPRELAWQLTDREGHVLSESSVYRILETHGLGHTRGAPNHPMTQGKIERSHRSMKNVVKLEKYYSPWELARAIGRFVDDSHHRRLHEALDNVTPADVYEGRRSAILARRAQIKQRTLAQRKQENLHVTRFVHRREVSLKKRARRSRFV